MKKTRPGRTRRWETFAENVQVWGVGCSVGNLPLKKDRSRTQDKSRGDATLRSAHIKKGESGLEPPAAMLNTQPAPKDGAGSVFHTTMAAQPLSPKTTIPTTSAGVGTCHLQCIKVQRQPAHTDKNGSAPDNKTDTASSSASGCVLGSFASFGSLASQLTPTLKAAYSLDVRQPAPTDKNKSASQKG